MSGPMDVGLSGGDVHALRLCAALAARHPAAVRLVTVPAMRKSIPPSVQDHVTEIRTPLDGHIVSMLAYFVAVTWRMLLAWWRAPASQVSVASTHFFFDVLPIAMRRRRGSAAVTYVYHLVQESKRPPGLRSWVSITLERFSLAVLRRVADIVFVDNVETHDALVALGFAPARLVMTANAYDPLLTLPPRAAAATPSVVFCGRLVEAKGAWDMIELAAALRDRVPEARIRMIGDGPLREPLLERLAERGLDNVDVLGFVTEEEKWRVLREGTLFVSPSVEEGWGIAVGEALTAGLPVVVYDLPAYSHLGGLPISVPVGDARALSERVVALLSAPDAVAAETDRVSRSERALPLWHDILAREIAALDDLGC
jgi:glycosyltransferase involved in cell wall biosynthesis